MPQATTSEIPFYSSNDKMRCYECRKVPATRLLATFRGLEIEDLYLCEECTAKTTGNPLIWLIRDLKD